MKKFVAIFAFYKNMDQLGNYVGVTRIDLSVKAKDEVSALDNLIDRAKKLAEHPSIAKEHFFVESFIEKFEEK